MPNFEWTDKDSVKWFILMPGGHEGPYSLNKLITLCERKKISQEVKIWSEGLTETISLKKVLELGHESPNIEIVSEKLETIDELPPIPETEEIFPPEMPTNKAQSQFQRWEVKFLILLLITIVGVFLFFKKDQFSIPRLSKMSLEIHEKILKENIFEGWSKNIFFREYLPLDHSHIWLITSGYQRCEVEASFNSIFDKLLTFKEERISFKTKGSLSGHVIEFSSFDFIQGNKIVPGLYEMDIKATNCSWDGLKPKLMNFFREPEKEYIARTKVILFSKGPVEYNLALENLIRKKLEIKERTKSQEALFWQDLTQKFQTLEAISLQIEQHFLDFLDQGPKFFKRNSKSMVEVYSKKFGSFLTSFVVENENYFKSIDDAGSSRKRNYELMVRLTSKKIGLESMKLIEEFLAVKKELKKKDLTSFEKNVRKRFSDLKREINQKLIQISEDQETPP